MGVLTSQINQLCSPTIGSGANMFNHVACIQYLTVRYLEGVS